MWLADIIAETKAGNIIWEDIPVMPSLDNHRVNLVNSNSRAFQTRYSGKVCKVSRFKQDPVYFPDNRDKPLPYHYELQIDGIETRSDQIEELFNCIISQHP
jgi:hypothetical protein